MTIYKRLLTALLLVGLVLCLCACDTPTAQPAEDPVETDDTLTDSEVREPTVRAAELAPVRAAESYAQVLDALLQIPQEDVQTGDVGAGLNPVTERTPEVPGVDEADCAIFDGTYLYVMGEGGFTIVHAADGETELVGQAELPKAGADTALSVRGLLVSGDRAALIYSSDRWLTDAQGVWRDETSTWFALYDVSDRQYPTLLSVCGQDGSFQTARMTGGTVVLVTAHLLGALDEVSEEAQFIPQFYRGAAASLIPAERIYLCAQTQQAGYTVVGTYAMQTGQTLDNCAFTDPSDTVYMTEENLYLMRTVMTETASEPYAEQQYTVVDYARRVVTEIKRLSLQDGVLTLAADAPVPGGMFDSLSIDVENGQLRVATSLYEDGYSLFTDESYGWENTLWYDSSRSNQITVLDEDLNILGACKDILPGEQLACVRFLGDIACLQTEVKGDPLFAVELSDPAALRLSCALEQTGMAAWAQPYTGKLWFLFGQSVDENGFANGVELVMYDAVDADGIILRNRLRLDNCYSAAADEQHTLLVSPEQNLIGFPVTKYNTWANNFVLFSYGESGFVRLGEIRLSNFSSDTRAFLTGQSLYLVSPYLTTVVDRASWKVTAELVTAVG